MSAAPTKPPRGDNTFGNVKVSVPCEPVKVTLPGFSIHVCWNPIAETAGLMSTSMPSGKGACRRQLLPEQEKIPFALVVLKVNCTPARVIVKLVAPCAALLGSNGSSMASMKAGSFETKINLAKTADCQARAKQTARAAPNENRRKRRVVPGLCRDACRLY
jgi:hypothetical protein